MPNYLYGRMPNAGYFHRNDRGELVPNPEGLIVNSNGLAK